LTRHAVKADRDAVADTLTRAFFDDPVMAWVFEDANTRLEKLRTWMELNFDAAIGCGHLYTVEGRGSVAVWSPPDVDIFDDPWGPRAARLLVELIGEAAEPKLAGLIEMTNHHPAVPHFYLMLLGTRPEGQGQGLGGSLLGSILERCDAQGLIVHLESSNPSNIPFYERHGFEVMCDVKLGRDGPVANPMQRMPR
jgi:ribosomal protein S18 acetylase RimI-like enzyme